MKLILVEKLKEVMIFSGENSIKSIFKKCVFSSGLL